jgi:hypothetical protein
MSTIGEQLLKHYVNTLLDQPNRKTRASQTIINNKTITMGDKTTLYNSRDRLHNPMIRALVAGAQLIVVSPIH